MHTDELHEAVKSRENKVFSDSQSDLWALDKKQVITLSIQALFPDLVSISKFQ